MFSRWALAGLAALAVLTSCGKGGEGVADVLLVATVEVSPSSGNLVLGGTAQLTATPKTASGLVVPGRTVSWSSSNSATVSVSPAGVIIANALGGPVRITATVDGVSGESQITVQPFPVARVRITPSQAGVVVGGTTELVATAYDDQDQLLPGRVIFWQSSTPAVAAVTSTGLVLGMAEGGPVTITATSEGKSGTATVTVLPRPATRLGFLQQPGAATAGKPITPPIRVAIQNDQDSTATSASNEVTIALTSNTANATLGGTTTVAAVNGIATFANISLDKAGTGYTLIASAAGLSSATSSPFANVAGPATQLTLTTAPPGAATSGVPLASQPVLQLRDAFGNPAEQAGVVITASVASGVAGLSGAAATSNGTGVASFTTLTLTGSAGTVTIAFSAPGLTSAVSGPITLTPPQPASLAMVAQPSATVQTGTQFPVQPVVGLRDPTGNAVTTAGVPITASLASGPAGATLSGGTVVQTTGTGIATFTNLAITGPVGTYALQFSSPGLNPVTSAAISVTPPPATQLTITTQPSGTAPNGASFPQQPVVQLRDASGNPVARGGVPVSAAIASGGGTLGGTATVSTDASGVARFTDLSITGIVGNRTLRFSSANLSGVTSAPVTITPGPATQLGITTQPQSPAAAGSPFSPQPAVQLRDVSGNAVSTGGVAITASLASGPAGGALAGGTGAQTAGTGVATFGNLGISGPSGSYTIRFGSTGLTSVTSAAIQVVAPPTQLAITAQPSSTTANGIAFAGQPVVQLRDASGNPVPQSGVAVSAAIASGGGTLGGTTTVLTNSSGAAVFTNLAITGAIGSRTLRFSASNLAGATSGPILVTAGPAAQLSITVQPSPQAISGEAFLQQPVIQLRDISGNLVSAAGVSITAGLNSGSGSLGGTLIAVTNSGGAASFSNLYILGTGSHTLVFSSGNLTKAVSITILVL